MDPRTALLETGELTGWRCGALAERRHRPGRCAGPPGEGPPWPDVEAVAGPRTPDPGLSGAKVRQSRSTEW